MTALNPNVLKWDTDELGRAVVRLEQELKRLTEHRDYIRGLKDTVANHWQSPAARQYLVRMNGETEELDGIIRQTQEQINALKKVNGQCYTVCESEVKASLSRLGRTL